MAFYRDAANIKFNTRRDIERATVQLRREIRRQIEHAIRDDSDLRENAEALELTDEDLCPGCGVPTKLHGTVHTGNWIAFVCAGVSGSKLFISPDAAARIVDMLTEEEDDRREPGDEREGDERDSARDGAVPLSGQ